MPVDLPPRPTPEDIRQTEIISWFITLIAAMTGCAVGVWAIVHLVKMAF